MSITPPASNSELPSPHGRTTRSQPPKAAATPGALPPEHATARHGGARTRGSTASPTFLIGPGPGGCARGRQGGNHAAEYRRADAEQPEDRRRPGREDELRRIAVEITATKVATQQVQRERRQAKPEHDPRCPPRSHPAPWPRSAPVLTPSCAAFQDAQQRELRAASPPTVIARSKRESHRSAAR